MLPDFLMPEQIVREDGVGVAVAIGPEPRPFVAITLGITRIIEQESLDLSIWGSSDGVQWGAKPLIAFPQKFYCGVYSVLLNLGDHPDVRYVRVQWKLNRWGRGEPHPMFGLYVFAEPAEVRSPVAAVA